jgi:hypothetical protein
LAPSHTRSRAFAFAVALGSQAALVAVCTGHRPLAALLLGVSTAEFTWLYLVAGVRPPRKPGILLTLILAVVLIVCGLLVGFNPGSEASASSREFATPIYRPPPRSTNSAKVTDKSFPGVILWPEVKKTRQKLTAPQRFSWLSPLSPVPRTPFEIPFTGQYWMFKPPQVAPPEGSYVRRSSPLELSFMTTDQRALAMQALQKLDHPLDLSCCGAIQIAISNADRHPGTIALELVLIDSKGPGQPAESLGKRDVASRPEASAIPVTEILDFPVPRAGIRKFDLIQVVFRLDFFRVDRSAKISIEHFTLVPP